jgi:hypothetical protein
MLEIGQRVFQTQLNADGVVESIEGGQVIIRFNNRDGKKSPYRSVYSPKWLAENPQSIRVLPLSSPTFHVEDIEELEVG